MALRGTLTHRKTRRLASTLGIDPCFALGVVEGLWHVTAEQAPAGDVGRMSDADIGMELFYSGDADALIQALSAAGFVDEHPQHRLVVHDWHIHSDDATDNKLSRAGLRYANGALPRMRRLSKEERSRAMGRYSEPCESVRTECHNSAQVGTESHFQSQSPEPVPEPVPENKGMSPSAPAGSDEPAKSLPGRTDQGDEAALIEKAFAYYCAKLGRDPSRYTLTKVRREKALARLRERTKQHGGDLAAAEADFVTAIDNLAASEWNRENGYIDWTKQIFRSPDEFESRLNWTRPRHALAGAAARRGPAEVAFTPRDRIAQIAETAESRFGLLNQYQPEAMVRAALASGDLEEEYSAAVREKLEGWHAIRAQINQKTIEARPQ